MQHLYISYPASDHTLAHRLVDDLQGMGYLVFIDTVSEPGTLPWAAETRHAIRSCGAMLMILSPAEGRRVGIRHEGVLANRARRPIIVLRRSDGDLPRYLLKAPVVDFTGDYATALAGLRAALPDPAALFAENHAPRRVPRRPPHQPNRFRRRLVWLALWAALAVLCLAVGIVAGVIPF